MKKTLLGIAYGMLCLAEVGVAGGITGLSIGVNCSACHGPEGRSEGLIPSIYGLPAGRIESTMRAFRSGKRSATIMDRIARGYTNIEIAAVAEYFANLD
jgi:sulfide dehydrogenase cytochrome subunit